MRIVIDMQGAQTESRFRGIGRYTMSFTQAVVRNRGEHEIILALSGRFPDTIEAIRTAFNSLLPQENIRVWDAPGSLCAQHEENETRCQIAELVREAFLASLQPDVTHVSSLFEGYTDDAVVSIGNFARHAPVSASFYDLIPLINPEHYLQDPAYERYYRRKVDYLKHSANLLLAISEFARQEGLTHLDLPAEQVVNISTAIDSHFAQIDLAPDAATHISSKCGITRPFVLYTGGDDERKNLPRLIQAYAALSPALRQRHQLLFAGKMSQGYIARFQDQATAAGLQTGELLFTGYVSDEELVQLYNLCALYVFPSWHEGFGLPALEAMACGAAVIGANASSLPEVIGLDEALFDPMDVTSIRAKMEQGLTDSAFRQRLQMHGLQQAKLFSWDTTAKRAIAAWELLHTTHKKTINFDIKNGIKPRLAFISPLPPERSGIADYSAELLPYLSKYYDIYVVVNQDSSDDFWTNQGGRIRDIAWLQKHIHGIDRVLYQFGNSSFHQHMPELLKTIPGVVVLHDFYLSGLFGWIESLGGMDGAWVKALYTAHGYSAVQMRICNPESANYYYPANFEIFQYAHGIITHSKYSQQLAYKWYKNSYGNKWETIPLLRSPASVLDKNAAKKALGFTEDDFLICSFGFLDPTKLNHRLLKCWLTSALAQDPRCHLIFVGASHSNLYREELLGIAKGNRAVKRIRITGFASPELFRQYLDAADIAVQLRTQSRGETSAAVLDCMNHALPVIVNANGSIAELDPNMLWMLPNEFDDAELINALETLWRSSEQRQALGEKARAVILENHAPAQCAAMYAHAIERFYQRSQTSTHALLSSIAALDGSAELSATELLQLSAHIAATLPLAKPAKRLFLDITATANNDLKSGIERVAHSITLALIEAPPSGYRVEPVYLNQESGVWKYRYARRYILELLGCDDAVLDDDLVEPEAGDILLGLDLSGDNLIQAQQYGLHREYRDRGVVIHFLVYDLLPLLQPMVFPLGADLGHERWLASISQFDGAICISKTVAGDFTEWIRKNQVRGKEKRPFMVKWSHQGADFNNAASSNGLPLDAQNILAKIKSKPSFLMVGTIEPRKAYLQTIEAFTQLWEAGADVNLVVVGSEGWKNVPEDLRRDIPKTVEQLRRHRELGKRLFWLEGISDEYLEKVYAASTCLIAASYGEGFGLPLIEAAQHNLPIIARDLPVFREVAGEHAYYFQADTPSELAQALQRWLALYQEGRHPQSERMPWLTWKESAAILLERLGLQSSQ